MKQAGLAVEGRHLPIGDVVWVARSRWAAGRAGWGGAVERLGLRVQPTNGAAGMADKLLL